MAISWTRPFFGLLVIFFLSTVVLVGGTAFADKTWDGDTDSLWSNGLNWDADTAPPAAGEDVYFDGDVNVNVDHDAAADTLYGDITFLSGADPFTISGNRIGVQDSGAVTNDSGYTQTFTADILSGGNLTLNANDSDLVFAGIVINPGSTLTLTGGDNLTLNGQISGIGSSLLIQATGTTALLGNNTYTGGTTLGAGSSTQVGDSSAFGTGAVTLGGDATVGTDDAAAYDLANGFVLGSTLTLNGGSSDATRLTISGDIDETSAGDLVINDFVGLGGDNTYTDGTTLNSGSNTEVGSSTAFGTGTVTLTGDATVGTDNAETYTPANNFLLIGSTLTLNGGSGALTRFAISGDIDESGTSGVVINDFVGLSGDNTYTGGTTLNADSNTEAGSSTAFGTGDVTLGGDATVGTDDAAAYDLANSFVLASTLTLNGGSSAATRLTISGDIDETSAGDVVINDFVGLNGDNTYTDGTTLNAASDTLIGHENAFGDAVGAITVAGDSAISRDNTVVSVFDVDNPITFSGNYTLDVTGGAAPATELELSGVISDGANTGTMEYHDVMRVSGTNTYGTAGTDGTVLDNALVTVANNAAFGLGDVNVQTSSALESDNSARSIANAFNINPSQTLTFQGNTYNMTMSGVISGFGSLLKTEDATLFLTGDSTFTGGTSIIDGRIHLTGSLDSAVTIASSGTSTLSGTGEIAANVLNSGTVSPGTDTTIGTLTVTDATYNNYAAGRYLYNGDNTVIGPDPTKDICSGDLMDIVDWGTASLAGTMEFVPTATITTSRTYETIMAEGGISGLFDTLTESDPDVRRLRQRLADGDTTHLLRAVNVDYSMVSDVKNIIRVGTVIENQADAVYNDGTDKDVLLTALDWLDPETEAEGALAQLLPYPYSGNAEVAMNLQQEFAYVLSEHVADYRRIFNPFAMPNGAVNNSADGGAEAAPGDDITRDFVEVNGFNLYAKVLGLWGRSDSERGLPRYNYDSRGFVIGVDVPADDNLVLGLGVGGLWTDVDYSRIGSSSDITSAKAMAYASWYSGSFHVDGLIGYGHDWYESKRHMAFDILDRTADAEYDANIYTARLDAGRVFRAAGFEAEPFAGIGYTRYDGESFSEKKAMSANLRVHEQTYDSLRSRLGLRLGRPISVGNSVSIIPEASVAWEHEFMDAEYDLRSDLWGASFKTDGYDAERNHYRGRGGLRALFGKNVNAFAAYSVGLADGFRSDSVEAGVGVSW
jgi:outer membrane autotransporter protein